MKGHRLTVLAFALVAAFSSPALTNDLLVAREALRDGLWKIARAHAAKVDSPDARLVQLECLVGEEKWDELKSFLDGLKEARGDGFDYYRALARGDRAGAMAILKKTGGAEGLVEVKLYEAELLSKGGDRDGAAKLWREVAATTNVGARAFAIASLNLMDAELLRRAYAGFRFASPLRRQVGLRLGMALMRDPAQEKKGVALVRALVADAPDADGAREAFLAVIDREVAGERWKEVADDCHKAIETWPDVAKIASVQEKRGWALKRLGRSEDALEAFRLSGTLATGDDAKAVALVEEGDLLQDLGREDEAMARYRLVLEQYGETSVAQKIRPAVRLRELEAKGREEYRALKFSDAMKTFAEIVAADPARREQIAFYTVLCLYGQGRDDEAAAAVRKIVESGKDPAVRIEATLWLAKFLFNRREWKESCRLFAICSAKKDDPAFSSEALLWAARAACLDNDFNLAIGLSSDLVKRYPDSKETALALLVQGEALSGLARFDEAVLVFERAVAADGVAITDRVRAQMLRADALYALGADNPSRYAAALEAYRDVRFGGSLSPSDQIVVAFRIGRALEKLKRTDEAMDQYYSQVVLAYREGRLDGGRFTDEARAAFSRAAFRLADEYERQGRGAQAVGVLERVAGSDVPAAAEATRRIELLTSKGRFL